MADKEKETKDTAKPAKTTGKSPEVGGIVHYVLDIGENDGEHRPAIIVSVEEAPEGDAPDLHRVNLQVFTDGHHDFVRGAGHTGLLHKTSVVQDEDNKNRNSWHWAEKI